MNILGRIILIAIMVPSAYYFTYWVPFSITPIEEQYWIASLASMLVAIAVGWFVWSSTGNPSSKNGLIASVVYWALIIGGVGFFAGFFGPLIFTPGANQGPMLGIFITGPAGFMLGAGWGVAYWIIQRRKADV